MAITNLGNIAAQASKEYQKNKPNMVGTKATSSGGSSGGGGSYSGGGGGGGGSSSSTSISYTSRPEAKYEIREAMRSAIGRNPTSIETKRFIKALRAFEKANPAVSSGSGSSNVTSGGVSAAAKDQFTYEYLRKKPKLKGEMDAKTMGTEYLDVFLKALEAPVKL